MYKTLSVLTICWQAGWLADAVIPYVPMFYKRYGE